MAGEPIYDHHLFKNNPKKRKGSETSIRSKKLKRDDKHLIAKADALYKSPHRSKSGRLWFGLPPDHVFLKKEVTQSEFVSALFHDVMVKVSPFLGL